MAIRSSRDFRDSFIVQGDEKYYMTGIDIQKELLCKIIVTSSVTIFVGIEKVNCVFAFFKDFFFVFSSIK